MTGGVRVAAGVAAVALVMTALGIASPTSADAERPTVRPEITAQINR
ncbi:MAG: hypothetical protein JWN68_1505 [Nocardioides sp.]|jgi:hypothetical protein|nr:hypothetical protein [Nocardioides sp.]MCW2833552.1 hypothetical protein [Nocardioides sp.]